MSFQHREIKLSFKCSSKSINQQQKKTNWLYLQVKHNSHSFSHQTHNEKVLFILFFIISICPHKFLKFLFLFCSEHTEFIISLVFSVLLG